MISRMRKLAAVVALLTLLVAAGAANRPAEANVTLLYFRATAQSDAIELEWRTATEFETQGYLIKRALSADGFAPISDDSDVITVIHEGSPMTIIPAAGDAYTYFAYDENVTVGQTYYYRLIEVEFDNTRVLPDGGEANAAFTGPTPTPTVVGISLPPTATPSGATATPAATATATATPPPPTSTPLPQPTNTPVQQPTNTPPPTATRPLPTATPVPVAVAPGSVTPPDDDDGFSLAVPVAEAVQDEGYPVELPTSAVPEGYDTVAPADTTPEPELFTTGADATPAEPVDSAPIGGDSAEPGRIGDNSQLPPPDDNVRSETQSTGGTNRLILWGGFVAGLLIFVGGVLGSIIIFNRR